MTKSNKYYRCSHISEAKFREIIRLFIQDLPASNIASISGVSRITINKLLFKISSRLAMICEAASPLSGEIEVDKSYFDSRRV